MFETPLTILSEDALDAIHDQAMTILEEIGAEVVHDPAREMLAGLGQKVDGTRVHFDREFVMEQLKLAPAQVTVQGRNPERAVTFGGGALCMLPPGGSPFVADRERGRRDGMYGDHVEVVKMTQATPLLRAGQSGACEAGDVPETSRHLDLDYSWIRYSDKPYVAYGTSGPRARDSVELAAISRGGREAIEADPAIIGIVNPNSPLVWDFLMVDAMWAWAEANQPIAMTPFLLAGATAPVSAAAGLTLQVAEALSGVAIAQAIRPGVGCFFGSFFSGVDMRSGGPSLGMPESVLGSHRRGSARPPLWPAVPRRRWADLRQCARRAGRDGIGDVALGHVPLRLRPGAARRRLARGRPHVLVREVRARPRGAAHVREPARRDSRSTPSTWRSRRSARRGRAGSSWPRITRWSTSASGSS